jgi:hypothetical protein
MAILTHGEHDLSKPEWRAKRRADARRMLAAYLAK